MKKQLRYATWLCGGRILKKQRIQLSEKYLQQTVLVLPNIQQ